VARSDGVVGNFDGFLALAIRLNNPLERMSRGQELGLGTTPPCGHPSREGNFIGRLFYYFPVDSEPPDPSPGLRPPSPPEWRGS